MSQVRGRKAHRALLVVIAVGVLSYTGVALAANQVKGASYSGQLAAPRTSYLVSFKVSASGKQVTALKVSNAPFYCSGGGRAIPVSFASATISKAGTFTSTGKYVIVEGPLKGQVGTKLKLTGKFGKHGGEQGRCLDLIRKPRPVTGNRATRRRAEPVRQPSRSSQLTRATITGARRQRTAAGGLLRDHNFAGPTQIVGHRGCCAPGRGGREQRARRLRQSTGMFDPDLVHAPRARLGRPATVSQFCPALSCRVALAPAIVTSASKTRGAPPLPPANCVPITTPPARSTVAASASAGRRIPRGARSRAQAAPRRGAPARERPSRGTSACSV